MCSIGRYLIIWALIFRTGIPLWSMEWLCIQGVEWQLTGSFTMDDPIWIRNVVCPSSQTKSTNRRNKNLKVEINDCKIKKPAHWLCRNSILNPTKKILSVSRFFVPSAGFWFCKLFFWEISLRFYDHPHPTRTPSPDNTKENYFWSI